MAPPPETPIFRAPVELLDDIFLRLPTAADLARASAACAPFRRLITNHAFLRRYRALHPPPLIGVVGVVEDDYTFVPAQPPHPSAVAPRAFAGFDFSCKSFLPTKAGRAWCPLDFFDGRALLVGVFECDPEVTVDDPLQLLVSDLAVCDPVHRRYILLPAVPGDLKALVRQPDLLELETFLAPGDDEEDPLSFRVMCLVQCRMKMLMLVFSSLDGQWHSLAFDQWSMYDPREEYGLSGRQFVHGCFCWRLLFLNKVVLLDTRTMEFSAIDLPPQQEWRSSSVIVEAAQGMLGLFTRDSGEDNNKDGTYWLSYFILRNNQWHSEKLILLPENYDVDLLGVAGGYLLIQVYRASSSQEELKFGLFSVDAKTLQVELFAKLSRARLCGRLYAGFPPSLCAPTI